MQASHKLWLIKMLHTVVWLFFVCIIFYILYCGIVDDINVYTWISITLVILEGVVLLVFKMFCPITIIARKYSDSTKDNFDIFLPEWLAKYNKLIFTAIFLLALTIVLTRVFG